MNDSMVGRDKTGKFIKGNKCSSGKGRPKGITYIKEFDKIYRKEKLTECEVRERFRILNHKNRWFEIILSQEGFPDFILKKDNKMFRAEVEIRSSDFVKHKHSLENCDLIICWSHTWKSCPVPILILSWEWKNHLELNKLNPFQTISKEGEYGVGFFK